MDLGDLKPVNLSGQKSSMKSTHIRKITACRADLRRLRIAIAAAAVEYLTSELAFALHSQVTSLALSALLCSFF